MTLKKFKICNYVKVNEMEVKMVVPGNVEKKEKFAGIEFENMGKDM